MKPKQTIFLILTVFTALTITTALAVQPEVLYSFVATNGINPYASLVQGPDGNFYGTTYGGGTDGGYGTVFKVTTNGALNTLVSFNNANGANPRAALTLGNDGNFYGTTSNGGTNGGYGTVFKITTNGTLTSLVSFASSNGANPYAGLTLGNDANFYGTTSIGGSNGYGTVFKVTSNGELTSLVSFALNNGAYPYAGLVFGSDGILYGTTYSGGSIGGGTVFKVTTNGTLTLLVSLNSGSGAHPQAGLTLGPGGNFYGTTYGSSGNGGTMFKVTTNGTLTTLAFFNNNNGNPQAGLTLGSNGTFYGTTSGGTVGYGTVFKVTTNGTLTTLVSFNETNGANPYAGLTLGSDGNFYGTTYSNPNVSSGSGTVFKTTTNGTLTTLFFFTPLNGVGPSGLTLDTDGYFYGTTGGGGSGMGGTVFSVTTNGMFTSLVAFKKTNGFVPNGLTLGNDGSFYGTTHYGGGSGNIGTVFKVTTNGTLTTLASFSANGTNGAQPNGLTLSSDGNFYGTGFSGGGSSYGTVFKVTTNGVLSSLAYFNGTNGGRFPSAGLVLGLDGSFYSTTSYGGSNGSGTVFKVTTNGTLTTLVSFNNTNGANPNAGLTLGNDGNFYGTTSYGGSNNAGTVFQVTTIGTLTSLVSFNTNNGADPQAALTLGNDGNFYGTTYLGGVNNYGTVFKVTTNGVLTSLVSFASNNGSNPYAGLTLGSDGNFYGTTQFGGSGGLGAIFRLGNPPTIMVQPASRTNVFNTPSTFSVSAVGGLPLSYRWRKNGVNMTDDFLFVNGSQTATLSLSEVSSTDAADYSVVVTNNYGSVTSAVATLTFHPATPFITWFNPSPITYGTALSSSAIASFGAGFLPGSYVYTPPPGTVLNTGTNTVCVVFTPTDTVDFSSVTSCVSVVVLPAPLTVTASNVTRAFGQLNPVFTGTITGLQNGDNITAKYNCSATATNLPGTYAIVPSLVDTNNLQTNYQVSLVSGTLTVTNSAILVVTGLQVTPSGFIASFNQLVDTSVLGLYTTNPAVFTALGGTSGPVQGSLVFDMQATQVTLIKSGGPLVPDTYTVRLLSATNNHGFRNLAGQPLDGDVDGVPGGDYVTQVIVAPFTARVVSMPDFARGPGQPVNIPASGTGIPISFSDGSNVLATSFTVEYDPALLHVTGAALGTNLPPGWALNYNLSTPGFLPVIASGSTPLATGQVALATIQADIPWSAPYTRLGIVNLTQAQANGGALPVIGDSAVQVIAFLGDVDGDRSYTTNDAYLIAQLAAQLISGFSSYPSADPVIIGDVNGDGSISILDSLLVVHMSQGAGGGGFIPNLPLPDLSSASAGANNQLTISWPQGADGYVLEQSGTLDFQSSWTPVTNTQVISGGRQTVTLTPHRQYPVLPTQKVVRPKSQCWYSGTSKPLTHDSAPRGASDIPRRSSPPDRAAFPRSD